MSVPKARIRAWVEDLRTSSSQFIDQLSERNLAEMDALDGREDEVEAGHPLRHDRPTHEEWLIEGIGPYG